MLVVATNAAHDEHLPWDGHPERPSRTRAALDGLVEAELLDAVAFTAPRAATTAELLRVHDAAYLDALPARCRASYEFDGPTPTSPGSWATAQESAGAGLAVVDALDGGAGDAGLVLTRPPGHHARPDGAMGFCLLNNIAVTAAALADRGERVCILDWDVHHGNGTQEAFWDDPRVLFVSLHQRGLYPNTGFADEVGGAEAAGLTMNLPLPAGATGDLLLDALDNHVEPVIDTFAPTWLLVSAGFDGHRVDPLADWSLSAGDYADFAARARSLVPASRLVLFLEGGYDLEALRLSTGSAAAALLGGRYRPEHATAGGPDHGVLSMLSDRRRGALARL